MNHVSSDDKINLIMQQAIDFAYNNIGYTSPNPSVCAIAADSNYNIIAIATTAKYGRPHAETILIEKLLNLNIKPQANLLLFTTLEPCSHYGKTPPCTKQIIESGFFDTVYVAFQDPDYRVSGNGIAILQQAKLKVFTNIQTQNAKQKLYTEYEYAKINKRPYITAKMAISLDGKIATQSGESKWLSNSKTKQYTDSMRYIYDGILVGRQTYNADNPSLTSKNLATTDVDPKKFVLTSSANFIASHSSSSNANNNFITLVCNSNLNEVCKELCSKHEINHLLVEGGAKTITNFMKNGLVNRLIVVLCPIIIGSEGVDCIFDLQNSSLNNCQKFRLISTEQIENDLILKYE